jgi:hypothetical protein
MQIVKEKHLSRSKRGEKRMKRKSPLGIALLGILLVSFLQLTLFIRPGKSDNGLLGLWNFDEGSGTVAHDSSDNGNDGILCNGPTRVNGKSGRALNFNGVDQYVEVAGNTDLNPHRSDWTVSAWVNIASLSVGPLSCGNYGFVIAGKRQDPYQEGLTLLAHWGSSATSQAKFCFIFDQPHAISGALTPLMNVFGWHYVVGVRNGANLTVYVDGVAYGPNNYAEGNPSPIDSDISSDTPLQFAHHGAWGEYDNGTIDEVRIYDRALSQQEIQSCMDPNSIKHYADDFSVDTGLWTYCGNAYRDNVSDDVVLTEAVNAQAGGIWLNESLRSSFTVKFKYWVGGTTGARTDGFVVKFYKQIDYSLPKGGYLGFSGLGYGIEFDTFRNDWDPSEDHIALIKDSWSNHLAWVDDARVSDDSWHNVTITVATSSIVVYLDSGRILSWNGTIDTTYGGFGFCGTTGEASWPTNDRHIIDDFSIDAPASQFDISITPAAISTSIGGKTRFAVTVDNQGGVTDIFNLNTFGLNSAWVNLSRDSIYLIAGQAAEIDLAISVPEDPFVVGTYPFCVIAQESLGVEKNASSQLTVFLNPIITNLAPENNTIIGSTDTLFSWCTSSNASSEVYIKQAGDLTFNNIIGAPGESHYISASNLTRNADYLWYAYSETANGNVSSDIRALHVSNGISFAQNVYAFNVERDYAQQASVSVINTDTESHQLLLQAINPYDDLIVGFVGPGSTDENLTIGPGETRSVAFNIFAQDAMQRNYTFTIKLTNLGPEQITDYALVNVNVRQPNVNLALIEESTDPATLSKTMTATNYGDPITDLYMDTSDELAGKVSFEPTVSHAYLPTGGSLTFKVVPVLTTDFTGIEGLITATSAGQVVASLPVNFTLPPGKSVFTIGVPTVSIEFSQYYDNDSSPNTNPLPVSPVETYIVNGSRVFASQIIVDVYQDGGPASDANVSLTVWNATGEILSVDDSQTDFTGKAMFVVFGQAGNYSYQAELVGYGLKTERRNFSTEFTSLFALHPNAISWLDISDRNSTYDLSQNVSRVTLEHAPFVFRGQKATIEDNTTATLYLRWDADPYKKIQIRGTIAGDTIVFNSSAIPIGNFSAIIFSYSPSFGLAYSSLINLTCLDSSAMYTQGNYSYQLPFPLNTTHIVQLNIEHTITQRDQNVAFDLYNIEPANSDTRYSLVYLVLANATVAKEFHVDVSTTEGELYNSTITFEVHANMPNTINFTVPVYYENGSLISEFKVTLSVGNDSLTVTVRPHELYFYDLRIWVGSGNGIWDSIMSHNPDPYGTIWASLSCGIGSFIGLASFGTTTVTEKTVLFGSSLVFDSVKMAISPKLDTVTAIKWAGVPLISGAQAVYAPMSMDYPPGSWADAYRKGFVPITLITCLSDYSKAMERWWKEGVERHILQPIGTMQSTKTAAIYCTNTPVVQARFSTVSPSGTRGSPPRRHSKSVYNHAVYPSMEKRHLPTSRRILIA